MLRKLLSVSGWTLVSRVTGFARDVVLAAVLGAGAAMDAFTVANRLPNHFRAIVAEGAFNSAFVPAYARQLETDGAVPARRFAGAIALVLGLGLVALTALAILFAPVLIGWLAPGFVGEPARFDLAVALTRITFPYLVCMALVTLLSGVLNAHERFAAAAAAPVLLNVAIVAALGAAFLFPSAAHAAAWGVLAAGLMELALVWIAAARAGVAPLAARPRLDAPTRGFLKAFGPALIGAAGVQIAMFADTILVTFLETGAPSALYYADRLYQLPVGLIGIAAGTVLLPEMSRHLAAGHVDAAHRAQNRAAGLTLLLGMPFAALFLTMPALAMEALFARGAFDRAAAQAAGAVLAAYAVGLPAVILIRSAVASFHARQDTTTPMMIALTAIAANVALKLVLMPRLGAPGLALATACGAWINVALLVGIGLRRGWMAPGGVLARIAAASALAALAMAGAVLAVLGQSPFILQHLPMGLPGGPALGLATLAGTAGILAYGTTLAGLLRLFGLHGRDLRG